MTQEEVYFKSLKAPNNFTLLNDSMWGPFIQANDGSCGFRLTDRTFGNAKEQLSSSERMTSDIDFFTNYAISKAIQKRIEIGDKPTILDVACGPLNLAASQIVDKYGKKVEINAIDIISSSLAVERDNLERKLGSGTDLPYEDESQDIVYSFQFISHLPLEERGKALSEILRVTKTGGECILDLFSGNNELDKWICDFTSEGFFNPYWTPWMFESETGKYGFSPIIDANPDSPHLFSFGPAETQYVVVKKVNTWGEFFK